MQSTSTKFFSFFFFLSFFPYDPIIFARFYLSSKCQEGVEVRASHIEQNIKGMEGFVLVLGELPMRVRGWGITSK